MTFTMYNISPHDTVNAPFLFWRVHANGRLVVMEEFQDLACKSCHKVNETAALSRGIPASVVVKSKRPFLLSQDEFYILDDRSMQLFSRLLPGEIDFYPIPSSPFFVASGRNWVQPDSNDPGFRFGRDRCTECGRVREVVWGRVPPTLASSPFISVNLEGIQGAREAWLVSKEVADELRKVSPPLTGMAIIPKQIDNGTFTLIIE